MKRLWTMSLLIALITFVLLYKGLFNNPMHVMPSALLDKQVPQFTMQNILDERHVFSSEMFTKQPIALLNIWATWCYACRLEHATLMWIKRNYHIPIYAIAYKDDRDTVLTWLKKRGNPYTMVALDQTGDVVIDFGIYGTPETYLIDKTGKVLYRHVGALDESTWLNDFLPMIKQYQQ